MIEGDEDGRWWQDIEGGKGRSQQYKSKDTTSASKYEWRGVRRQDVQVEYRLGGAAVGVSGRGWGGRRRRRRRENCQL